jgi:hypothetical protein
MKQTPHLGVQLLHGGIASEPLSRAVVSSRVVAAIASMVGIYKERKRRMATKKE